MQQRVETTLIVDGQGGARLDGAVAVPPGRHQVIVLVDEVAPHEAWDTFIARTFGSLADSDLTRPPQGDDEIA